MPEPLPRAPGDKDINAWAILLAVAGFVVAGMVVQAALWGLQSWLVQREEATFQPLPPPAADLRVRLPRDITEIPKPRLQVSDTHDLERLRKDEDAVLDNYGWVDRKNGIVHIPIQKALEQMATKGLPTRDQKKAEKKP